MSTLNDYEDLHDEGVDDDDDHELEWSGEELYCFTDRAMPHGRRAATWLLVGVLAELAVFVGFGCIDPSLSKWLHLPVMLIALALMASIAVLVQNRWVKHRDRMKGVIEEAMGWMAAAQRKALGGDTANHRADRVEEERIETLRKELTWNVGPAPVYIDAEGHCHPTAEQIALEEHARREFDHLFDWLADRDDPDDREEPCAETYAEDSPPAVRAWIERWARLKPVKQQRPAPLLKRHSDAEGRRLERELCRAINAHWTGAFHKLLNEGADPNGHDGRGQPLRKAVLRGRLEHVSWLLTLGADPNAQPFGRTILQAVMTQVEIFADETERGDGDACEWPEVIELLARWGANAHIENRYYDRDDENEGPTAWPFIVKRPVLYEAYMKGVAARQQAEDDARAMLGEACEAGQRAKVADDTESMLARFRIPR